MELFITKPYLIYFGHILPNETVEELLGKRVAAQVPLSKRKDKVER
jgi:hypothetical protein